jgi:hypothetical protein
MSNPRVDLETDLPPRVETDPLLTAELENIERYGNYSYRRKLAACKVAELEVEYYACRMSRSRDILHALDSATAVYTAIVAAEEKEQAKKGLDK